MSDKVTTSKSERRPPLKAVLGVILFTLFNALPAIMIYIYYLAVSGSIVCIVFSIIQIVWQQFAQKSSMYLKFMNFWGCQNYFDQYTLEFEETLAKNGVMLAIHPHNVFTLGLSINSYCGRFGDNLICASRVLLQAPLLGLVYKLAGLTSVDAGNLTSLMKRRKNISIIPGGFEEATLTTQKENRVFILQRKGFIKYAIRYGYKIYPVFAFNENKMYNTVERFETFRLLLNKIKLVGVIFWSRFGILPDYHTKINTVVGKAISPIQDDHPTEEIINQYHARYVESLKLLFETHKAKYGETGALSVY